jgi:hypothetical protein
MDLRAYYRKVREVESQLEGEHIVLVSEATPEGGREGVFTEAPRAVAAKLISEGRARAATKEEAKTFFEERRRAKEAFDQDEAAKRVQVMVIPSNDLRKARERN